MVNASLQSFLLQQHHSFLNSSSHDNSPSVILKLTTNTRSSSISFKLFSNASSSSVSTASTPDSSAPTPVAHAAATNSPLHPPWSTSAANMQREITAKLMTPPVRPSSALLASLRVAEGMFSSRRSSLSPWRTFVPLIRSGGSIAMANLGTAYSVQRLLPKTSLRDYTRFFIKLGWMKKLDTEVEQFNYRAFPDEFMWELNDDTPEGHLPLTNALRGTRLLGNVLTHPAFEEEQEEATEQENEAATRTGQNKDDNKGRERPKIVRDFKPDYF